VSIQTAIRNPKPAVTLAAALLLALVGHRAAHAVVVLKKGETKPVMGYLVRHDEHGVVLREPQPGGTSRELTFAAADIDELILTVSPERLAELDPARPELYREYAEELAEKQRDPEARDMAIRLYHLAAVHGSGSLRRGSLLGLVALARSPQEERRFRAAAWLYDPQHDPSLLASPAGIQLTRTTTVREPLAELLTALRLCRQGKGPGARSIVDRPAVRAELDSLANAITAEEFLAACSAKDLSDAQLLKLLRAEVAIDRILGNAAAVPAEEMAARPASWSSAVRAAGLAPVASISLASLTEFNPQASIFRNGKWIAVASPAGR
jgi:hypothetical protein